MLDDAVLARLKRAGVPPTHALLRALATSARAPLRMTVALELLPADKLAELLSTNILAAHPNGTVTFGGRRVEVLMRELERGRWW